MRLLLVMESGTVRNEKSADQIAKLMKKVLPTRQRKNPHTSSELEPPQDES
jgi:hypothetical protein